MGIAGKGGNPNRSATVGWSSSVSRRFRQWLYSVRLGSLSGNGFAFTLTIRHCPDSAQVFTRARLAFIKRLERRGAIRLQWLVEWQGRGVPHVHGIVYFPDENTGTGKKTTPAEIIREWLAVTGEWSPLRVAQCVKPVAVGVRGWLEYQSKHAGRGVRHYQRQRNNMPVGWVSSGRMWGYRGAWSLSDKTRINLPLSVYHRLRRAMRGYNIAAVRARCPAMWYIPDDDNHNGCGFSARINKDAAENIKVFTGAPYSPKKARAVLSGVAWVSWRHISAGWRRELCAARGMLRRPAIHDDDATGINLYKTRHRSKCAGLSGWVDSSSMLRYLLRSMSPEELADYEKINDGDNAGE